MELYADEFKPIVCTCTDIHIHRKVLLNSFRVEIILISREMVAIEGRQFIAIS